MLVAWRVCLGAASPVPALWCSGVWLSLVTCFSNHVQSDSEAAVGPGRDSECSPYSEKSISLSGS